jgi:hypothetical protein
VADVEQRDDPGAWVEVFMTLVDRSHLSTGDRLSAMLDDALAPVGLRAEVMLADLPQRGLHSIRPGSDEVHDVEGSLAGRAFQQGDIVLSSGSGEGAPPSLWLPMLDGTERVGVMRVDLAPDVVDDHDLRRRCASVAGTMAHTVMTKLAYSDWLRRLRTGAALSTAAELLWSLVPPRTFSSDRVVISALLEPALEVGGDAYDYAADVDTVDLAVYDGVGHDLDAGLATTLAMTTVRNARRSGETGMTAMAARADRALRARTGSVRHRFVTAVLARLDTRTGAVDFLLAGHPPPLLLRDGRMVKELRTTVRGPLGVLTAHPEEATVGHEQLEPGDRLVFYSDGILEARDTAGGFFGYRRLVEFVERTELDHLSAPETLRRLRESILVHQSNTLQDDATLLMVEWSGHQGASMFPSTYTSA